MRIITKLTLAFLGVALVVLLLGLFASSTSTRVLEKITIQNYALTAKELDHDINSKISERIADLQIFSRSSTYIEGLKKSNQNFAKTGNIQRYIANRGKSQISTSSLKNTLLFEGPGIRALSKNLGEEIKAYQEQYGYKIYNEMSLINKYGFNVAESKKTTRHYLANEKWWNEAIKKDFYIGNTEHNDGLGSCVMPVYIKIKDNNKAFLGVLKVVYNLKEIQNLIDKFADRFSEKLQKQTQLYLFNERGEILFSTDKSKIFQEIPAFLIPALRVKSDKTYDINSFFAKEKNQKKLFVSGKVRICPSWTFAVGFGKDLIFAQIMRLKRNILLLSVILLFIAIIIGFLISRSISVPIIKLQRAALKIGKGKFHHRVNIKTKDELGQLGESFNEMALQLNKSMEKEKKFAIATTVAETEKKRAAELKVLNNKLSTANVFSENIIKSIVDSLLVLSPDANIEAVNDATCKLLGYKKNELINKPVSMIIADQTKQGLDKILAPAALISRNYEILAVNDEFLKTLDLKESEIIGHKCHEITHNCNTPCAPPNEICPLQSVLKNNYASAEIHKHFLGRQEHLVLVSAAPILDINDETVCYLHICRSIGKNNINKSQKNNMIKQIVEYTKEFASKIQSHNYLISKTGFADILSLRNITNYNLSFKSRTGKIIPVSFSASAMRNKIDKITGIVAIAKDMRKINTLVKKEKQLAISIATITAEKKRADELEISKTEAEAANKAKSDFIASMSHELRTPLNGILGFTDLISIQCKLSGKGNSFLMRIKESGIHLLNLINDILDISKIESGKMNLAISFTNLYTIVKRSTILLKEKAHEKNITILLESDDKTLSIHADSTKLKQILFNMISNAIKFTPSNGKIEIKQKKEKDNFVLISVSDNGIGIEPKERNKVFDKFRQIDTGYTRRYGGTGLGMPLTKQLVELHGGKIWFESEGENKGTCFFVKLPLTQDDPTTGKI